MKTIFNLHELRQTVERIADVRGKHLDILLTAFLQETGRKPSKCALVERRTKDGVEWYFQVRQSD
jgi:hypothetical protein